MTMHSSGHSSPNGLGLADSLAQINGKWPRSPSPRLGSESSIASSEVDSDEEGDSTPDPSATLQQDNTEDLFKRLYEIEQQNKRNVSVEPGSLVNLEVSSPLKSLEGSPQTSIHSSLGTASPETAQSNDGSYESSPVDIDENPVIQETPHEFGEPKILSIWALKDGIWKPAQPLNSNNGQLIVKFPGEENAVTVFSHETRPLELEVDQMVRTEDFDGEFRIADLIKDPESLFCTPSRFSRVELSNGGKPEMVLVERLYTLDERPQKRHKPLQLFEDCIFALTLCEKDTDLLSTIRKHGGTIVEELQTLVQVRETGVVWGDENFRFGAIIAPNECQTPKFLQGLAMGLPCLKGKYIDDCLKVGTLIDPSNYVLASLHREYPNLTLEQQFNQRTIITGPIVPPVCLVGTLDSPLYLLLVLACGKPIQVISSVDDAPDGSLVLQEDGGLSELPRCIRDQLPRKVRLVDTIEVSKEWLIKCVTSGHLV